MKNMRNMVFVLSLVMVLACGQLCGMKKKVNPTIVASDEHFCITYFFLFLDQETLLKFRLASKDHRDWVTKFSGLSHGKKYIGRFIVLRGATKKLLEKDGPAGFLAFLKDFGPCIGFTLPKEISNNVFKKLMQNKHFQEKVLFIDADGCEKVTNFSPIKHCSNVIELDLSVTKLTAPQFKQILTNLPKLQELILNHLFNRLGNRPTKPGLNVTNVFEDPTILKKINNLISLDLSGTIITDKALQTISENLSELEIFDLTYNDQLTNFCCLGKLKNLKELYISANKTSMKEVELMLAPLTQLKILELVECQNLKRFPWQKLANLKKLEELTLRGAFLTNEHLGIISQNLPKLAKLHLFNSCAQITDYTPLTKLTQLRDLAVTRATINNTQFSNLIKNLSDLRTLNINYCKNLTDLTPIACHKNLTFLSCDRTKIDNKGLDAIATNCPHIKALYLNRCENITDFTPLAKLTNLKELSLSDTKITDDKLIQLVKQLPKLKFLVCSTINQATIVELRKRVKTVYT